MLNAQKAVDLLLDKGLTVAAAESCTGGLIAKLITDIPGSSAVFHCGAVTYSNGIKEKLLGVPHEILEKYGAVSRETAEYMIKGVLALSGADFALATTGIAGPVGDGVCEEAGLMFAAAGSRDTLVIKEIHSGSNDREFNRALAAQTALELLTEII